MKRSVLLLTCAGLLVGPACKKEGETQKKDHDVQTTVETEQSEDKDGGSVKVRVRTPAGDYNVDVNH